MSGKTSETRCKWCQSAIVLDAGLYLSACEGRVVSHCRNSPSGSHEPTPPEGEAVPEQFRECAIGAQGFPCNCPPIPIPAPVVSTAAPEPPTIKVQRYDPIAEIQEIANNLAKSGDCIGSLKLEAAINVLAPDSYKPAEEVMPTATEDDNRSHIRRSAKEASLKTPGLAATPVTVEAPEPKWPALDPENGDFTDGWNQAIDLCKEAFSKWATPKPIGDIEALLDELATSPDKTYCQRSRTELRGILSPLFTPRCRCGAFQAFDPQVGLFCTKRCWLNPDSHLGAVRA